MPKMRRKRRGKLSKNRRDSLRNEPAVVDVGKSFVHDAERIRSIYHSRDKRQLEITFVEDSNNVEEQDDNLRNGASAPDLDAGEHFVYDIEQM